MYYTLFSYPIHLLLTHGYLALFLWSVMEGEIGLMLSGWLAYKGEIFSYSKIVPVAIAGAFIGDILLFSLGRFFKKKVKKWLDEHPQKSQTAKAWFHRWGPFVIVFERFVYGTHIPVLLTLGMSNYGWLPFLLYDIIGIVLWAFTFVTLGYAFGESIITVVIFFQKNLLIFMLLLLFVYVVKKIFENGAGS